jgi:hypothetical protein
MRRNTTALLAVLLLGATPYPTMAPLSQYLMPGNAEIVLARSAAPPSISSNATVLVLGHDGYTTAVHGTNGFTCLVERSWTAGIDDPEFWNPKLRGPNCYNAAATRSYVPIVLMRTKLILAGKSKAEAFAAVTSALDTGQLPALEPGAMCYMMSKQQYLNDSAKAWHPHLMFFVPLKTGQNSGADLTGSPVMSSDDPQDHLTILMVIVRHWSDGTKA